MERLRDRYRVLREVPGARPVAVFRALDRVLDIEVALKTLPVDHALAPALVEEGRRHHPLRHPGLVHVTTRFTGMLGFDDRPVLGFATAWAAGPNLLDWARERSDHERLAAIAELARTLDWLRRRGWLHLDVKPDNLVMLDGRPVLLDLGSALPVGALAASAGGTLGYAAPEIVAGQAPDSTSDLFSVGVLLFELLAGQRPHRAEGSELRRAVLEDRRVPLAELRPDLDPRVVELCEGLLAAEASARPEGPEAVLDALAELGVFPSASMLPVGEAPYLGREDALEAFRTLIDIDDPRPIAVLGESGLGRQRLIREHMAQLELGDGAWCLDLTQAQGGRLSGLERFARVLGAPGTVGDPRLATWGQRLRPQSGAVYAGRWGPDLAEQAELLGHLARSGLRVLFTAGRVPAGCAVFGPPPVDVSVIRRLAVWWGLHVGEVEPAAREAGGRVGFFLERLLTPEVDVSALPDEVRSAWPALSVLPVPLRPALADALPAELRSAWEQAVASGLFVAHDRGYVPTVLLGEGPPASRSLADWGQCLLASEMAFTPAERALVAARTGQVQVAAEWLAGIHHDFASVADVAEVAALLVPHGDRNALHLAAVKAHKERDHARRDALIARLPASDPFRPVLEAVRLKAGMARAPVEAILSDWLDTYGDHPRVRGEWLSAIGGLQPRDYAGVLVRAAQWQEDPEIDDAFLETGAGSSALLNALALLVDEPGNRERLREACAPLVQRALGRGDLCRRRFYSLGKALLALGDVENRIAVGEAAVRRLDQIGSVLDIGNARAWLGSDLMDLNRADWARTLLLEAKSLVQQSGSVLYLCDVLNDLSELEISCRRMPTALRYLNELERLQERVPEVDRPSTLAACHVLRAEYLLAMGRPEEARRLMERMQWDAVSPGVMRNWCTVVLADAWNGVGLHGRVLEVDLDPESIPSPNTRRRFLLARGRAHLAAARQLLEPIAIEAPEEPDPMVRQSVGLTLLTAAGEDLDPDSFGQRRERLARATTLLSGEERARAVALRERLLEGPGAALEQIVQLIESIGDGPRMLEHIAQVVSDALSANRVLVMLRMPGLGRQLTSLEISGQESAGLAPEIWRRVRRPDDVWLADDAFADPNLRRMSATVRTFEIKSVVAVAIPREGEVIGALYVDDVHRSGRFGDSDVAILKRLASAIGKVAEVMPARPRSDGLTVHDVYGVYTCDADMARRAKASLQRAASTPQTNLLLCGGTGVGKTWMARRVATEVLGLDGLVEVVMHPGPTEMLVSRLWGTRRGDFTGAVERAGAIFQAWRQNRALFIDELQNLDEVGQRVLLPLLELPHRRFGSLTSGVRELDRPLHIILGTNAVVKDGAWSQVFREDLWYRISPIRIELPPLEVRGREAVYRHLEDLLNERGMPAPEVVFERGALQRLVTHTWPGNLRTLGSIADQAAFRFGVDGRPIPPSALEDMGLRERMDEQRAKPGGRESPALMTAQARAVLEALERHDYMQSAAAEELGLSKYALHRKLKKLELLDHVREKRHARKRDA